MKKLIVLTLSMFTLTCIFAGGAECASCEGKVCRYVTDCTPLCNCLKSNGNFEGICL